MKITTPDYLHLLPTLYTLEDLLHMVEQGALIQCGSRLAAAPGSPFASGPFPESCRLYIGFPDERPRRNHHLHGNVRARNGRGEECCGDWLRDHFRMGRKYADL